MLTGRYPHQIEAWDLGVIADQRRHQTWGHHLGQADYRTVLCGRTHFNGSDRLMGLVTACWTICRNGTGPVVVRRLAAPMHGAVLTLM